MKGRRNLVKSAALALLVLIATSVWADGDAPREVGQASARQVHGAWKVNHIPGPGGPPPFLMLMVLTRDGGVVQTDAGPPNPLQFSPGIGEWIRKSDGRYTVRYTQMEFDAAQTHTGMFDGLMDVALDDSGNTFSGTVRVRFSDLDGVVLFEAYGTVEGKRLPVE